MTTPVASIEDALPLLDGLWPLLDEIALLLARGDLLRYFADLDRANRWLAACDPDDRAVAVLERDDARAALLRQLGVVTREGAS